MSNLKMLLFGFCAAFVASGAIAEEWKFGIGTGLGTLNVDGDSGFNTRLGPIAFDASLDFDEVRELMSSAFGFGANYIDHDFENDDEGDEDWFFYDASEYGVALSFLYLL